MSIKLFNDVELIKEQLTKLQANISGSVSVADIAQLIHQLKELTTRVEKLEKRIR